MRKYWWKPAGGGLAAGRLRPGWTPLCGLAAAVALVVTMTPGAALASPAGPGRPATRAGSGPARTGPTGTMLTGTMPTGTGPTGIVPTRRACPPTKAGYAACLALVRTDPASHQGTLTPGATPAGYGPADLQSAYKLPSATAGAGATVAVIDAYDDPAAAADLAVYRKQFGLPPCTVASGCFRKTNQWGGRTYPPRDLGWSQEISLDLDMVSATCPKCHILLVEASSPGPASLGAAVNEAVALGAKYVSNSYAVIGAGTAPETRWDARYYNHPGVVITASSGDYSWMNAGTGSLFGPSFPADSPHVVAVGGTSLTRDPSSPRGWSETVWGTAAGGGGPGLGTGSGCGGLAEPAWQRSLSGNPCAGQRAFSDVSAVANPATGVAVYDSYSAGGWNVFGGTSASSPLIASAYALAGHPAGGSYPAASLYTNHASLNDITTGNNDGGDTSCGVLCNAGPGWDGPTGWGTPDGVSDFAAGPHGTVSGTVTDSSGAPVTGAEVLIGTATAVTGRAGRYSTTVLDGSYTPSASLYGYDRRTASKITVTSGATVMRNFALTKQPLATVTGTVRDASGHGWPLYAQIRVPGTPVAAYTNPVTGGYRISLPAGPSGSSYRLDVSAQYPGYRASATAIRLGAGGLHQDVGLKVDALACTAPGYRPVYHGYSENFSSGTKPAGWTVSNTQGTLARFAWKFSDPQHVGNHTGGSGGFAIADAMKFNGLTEAFPGTWLTTPVLDLSGDTAPVLRFRQDLGLNAYPYSAAAVDVSTDGGQTWSQAYWTYQSAPGPATMLIPLPQAAGQSRVRVQFVSNDAASSWEIDDVFVGSRACRPVGGGLVVGQVRDRNTGRPVNGATVAGGGQRAVTAPEPGDPAVGGGLYWLPARSGPLALTAVAGGYATGAARVHVAAGTVTRADLSLAAGRLAVKPAAVAVTEPMGGTRTVKVQVSNTGSAPVTVRLTAQAGPVTRAGQQPRVAAGAPLMRIRGHYSPGLGLGLTAGLRDRGPAASGGAWVPPWARAAHYPDTAFDNAAATDPVTGAVYSVGGLVLDACGCFYDITTDGFVYHPAGRVWTQLPALPRARAEAAVALAGGKLYVTDGYDSNGVGQAALDIYDSHTGRWSAGAPIPHAGYGAAATVLDGKMYVVGGCPRSGVCTYRYVQVYDPATSTWSQAAVYPRQISFLGCGAIAGRLYCAGGFDHGRQAGTTAAYVYDPAADAWSPVASLPADLWGGVSAAANGQLLVSGGITRFDQELTNQSFAYDPASNTWSALPNAPQPLYRGGAACGFYTVGGLGAAGPVAGTARLPGYGECDGGTGVAWLTENPVTLTLAPGQHATVTLTLTASAAAVPRPGRYTATLTVNSGVPYPAPQVPVTLTATRPHD